MHSVRIHTVINLLISIFYRMGIWHRSVTPTAKEIKTKAYFWFYYSLFIPALAGGAMTSDSVDEIIFLVQICIMMVVLAVKFWILIWKQEQILDLLNRICVFSIGGDEDFAFFNRKMGKFIKFATIFVCATFFACCCAIGIVPFVGSEKKLIVGIAFPLDYRNKEISFWIAYIFVLTEAYLSVLVASTSVLIWYLMLNCSLRCGILGSDIRNMGKISENEKKSDEEKHELFAQDLTSSIEAHLYLKELTDDMASFTSSLFFIQFATSGMCICGSICTLAFNVGVNFVERIVHLYTLIYHIAELYMITYFGNEIMLSSGGLTYCLFESNWIEQPQATKKSIIVFAEYLKRPYELLIGKLYPLTLETFIRILRSAYSLFNILKNAKK